MYWRPDGWILPARTLLPGLKRRDIVNSSTF
jgi:hypothetical protein